MIQAEVRAGEEILIYRAEFEVLPRLGDTISIPGGRYRVVEVDFYRPAYEEFFLHRVYLEKD